MLRDETFVITMNNGETATGISFKKAVANFLGKQNNKKLVVDVLTN